MSLKTHVLLPVKLHELTAFLFKEPVGFNEMQEDTEVWSNETVMHVWKRKDDVKFGIPRDYIKKLSHPKITATLDKCIKLFIHWIEKEQYFKPDKEATAYFMFKNVALELGHTEDEVKKGGSLYTSLKETIWTGAIVHYKIPGKNGEEVEYEPFYSIIEPSNRKGEWEVTFNSPYSYEIGEILDTEAPRYFCHAIGEISDLKTSKCITLHNGYNKLVSLRPGKKSKYWTMGMKVINFLKDIGVCNQHINRPKEATRILIHFISHMLTYTNEIEEVKLINKNKVYCLTFTKKNVIPLSSAPYHIFRDELYEYLKTTNLVNDCLISFHMPSKVD